MDKSAAAPETMVQGSKSVARTVELDQSTKEMPVNKIENYYDFPSSDSTAYETYSKRASALEAALGNKDSVKG